MQKSLNTTSARTSSTPTLLVMCPNCRIDTPSSSAARSNVQSDEMPSSPVSPVSKALNYNQECCYKGERGFFMHGQKREPQYTLTREISETVILLCHAQIRRLLMLSSLTKMVAC